MPFNFALLSTLWSAHSIESIGADYERALPACAWPNWVLGNHDRPRVASRVGAEQARVAAMLLLTLRGTPTLYYGDEIGMRQVAIVPDQVQDPFEKNVPGIGVGRDGCRTPMQWSARPHAGFSMAKPWLPPADDFARENVVNLDAVSDSSLRPLQQLTSVVMGPRSRAQLRTRRGRRRWMPLSHRLICAFNVSSTTRSNDDAFDGALARWSATYLSRIVTSAPSLSFSSLRWFICLLTSSMRASGFNARRLSGNSSSFNEASFCRPAAMSLTRSPSPVTASEVDLARLLMKLAMSEACEGAAAATCDNCFVLSSVRFCKARGP